MTLAEYFEDRSGSGVLSTSDTQGNVDAAIYSRPHFLKDDDQTLTWIMADHQSYANLQSNPRACFLFIEEGSDYQGKRLYLMKIGEEKDPDKIRATRRKSLPYECTGQDTNQFLVHFKLEHERPLVGDAPKGK